MKLNLLCLIGAAIGIASIFLYWRSFVFGFHREGIIGQVQFETLSSFFSMRMIAMSSNLVLLGLLFIIGTIISLFSPAGSFVQLPSVLLIFPEMLPQINYFGHVGVYFQISPDIGPFIALISSLIVLASLFVPLGTGLKIGILNLRKKLLVIHVEIDKDSERHLDLNLICLVGAFVGVLSLITPWVSANSLPYPFGLMSPIDLLQSSYFSVIGAFIIGTLASFATPLGVTIQIAGIGMVMTGMNRLLSSAFHVSEAGYFLPGFYIGIISIVIIIIGIIHPIWSGHKTRRFRSEGWFYDRATMYWVKSKA